MTDRFEAAQKVALTYLTRPASRGDVLIEHQHVADLNAYRFYQQEADGLAIIVGEDGGFLLANERVSPTRHIDLFAAGHRTDPSAFGDSGYIHPDLVRLVATAEAARSQGYTRGDVNHYTQPIIGMLRLRHAHGEPLTEDDFTWAVESLTKATYAELAWLDKAGDL